MTQATRSRSDSRTKTCTADDCERPMRARGLCSTHYNQANPKVYVVECAACGRQTHKYARSHACGRRPACSDACRSYLQFGLTACPVPAEHPSRSCPVPIDHWSRAPLACSVPAGHPSQRRECDWCGATHTRHRFCSRRCLEKAKVVRRKAHESDGRTYSWTQVMRVFLLLEGRCAYCDQTPNGPPDPDHVIPISRRGSNGDGNILPSCRPCNSDKRDLLLHEWADDRARRGKSAVRTVFDRTHPAFAHLLPTVLASAHADASHAA